MLHSPPSVTPMFIPQMFIERDSTVIEAQSNKGQLTVPGDHVQGLSAMLYRPCPTAAS